MYTGMSVMDNVVVDGATEQMMEDATVRKMWSSISAWKG